VIDDHCFLQVRLKVFKWTFKDAVTKDKLNITKEIDSFPLKEI